MIKKVLGRSAGGTAIAGLVLAVAPVSVAPQIVNVACGYPAQIPTTTTLTLQRSIAPYGSVTSASVTVADSVPGEPTGQVRLIVNGVERARATLSAGHASFTLPRRLKARKSHTITAEYLGVCAVNGYQSSKQTKFYTVFKARTATRVKVVNARSAKFRARVIGSTGLVVRGGQVAFVVKNAHGTKIRFGIRKLRRGVARIDMRNLPHGRYKVVARYLGSHNWKKSNRVKRFRVR